MTALHDQQTNINNSERRKEWTAFKIAWLLALATDTATRGLAHDVGTWLALYYHNAKCGEAWPGVDTLAATLGANPRSVQRALDRLEAGGWVERERRPGRSSRYRLGDIPGVDGEVVEGVNSSSPLTPAPGVAWTPSGGGVDATPGVAFGSERGGVDATRTLRENPGGNPEREPGERAARPGAQHAGSLSGSFPSGEGVGGEAPTSPASPRRRGGSGLRSPQMHRLRLPELALPHGLEPMARAAGNFTGEA
jgi:hypothetical protein